jgi:hypothetical protein
MTATRPDTTRTTTGTPRTRDTAGVRHDHQIGGGR